MAVPAKKIEPERFMEERVARLEANAEHMQSDLSEMKLDIRGIRGEFKELDQRVSSFALKTEQAFAELKISRMADRVWWLLMSAALLAVMARGFKWL